MLILCYGQTKSGTTLAFELIKSVLDSAGHKQHKLLGEPVDARSSINYIEALTRKKLNDLLSTIGSRWIAVKTHSGIADPLFAYVERLQGERRLQLVVSYRDPRDICLSLLDAGEAARVSGAKRFSHVTDLAVAKKRVAAQAEIFFKWAAVPGALLLYHDMVAFDPDTAIDRIESRLGLHADHEGAKRHVFEEAFTQKSKAQRNRFLSELTEQQNEEMKSLFSAFISNFIDGEPERFLSETRSHILQREILRRASGARDVEPTIP